MVLNADWIELRMFTSLRYQSQNSSGLCSTITNNKLAKNMSPQTFTPVRLAHGRIARQSSIQDRSGNILVYYSMPRVSQ